MHRKKKALIIELIVIAVIVLPQLLSALRSCQPEMNGKEAYTTEHVVVQEQTQKTVFQPWETIRKSLQNMEGRIIMKPSTIIIIAIAVIIVLILLTNIRIVPQAHEYILERFGKYKRTWGAGIHMKIPFADRIARRITLKEQVLDSPPQPVITKDNVTMQIDTVVFFKVFDSKLYTYGVIDPLVALENLAATTLRNIVGGLDLDGTLTSRDQTNALMTQALDEATDQWGIKVTRVELKNIIPPKEIQQAMEKQMKAERDKREALLQAEGHKAAAITRAEGDKQAMILAAEGERDARIARAEGEAKAILLQKQAEADGLRALRDAAPDAAVLELKKYESLVALSKGNAAKIIVPTDVVDTAKKTTLFSELTELGSHTDPLPQTAPAKKGDPCCKDDPKLM